MSLNSNGLRPRLGHGALRVLVTNIYERRCAVSKERTLPALEAAHIRPYSDGGDNEASNGLLFRRDIHSLFDAGYVTVTPDMHFEVSRRIKSSTTVGTIMNCMVKAFSCRRILPGARLQKCCSGITRPSIEGDQRSRGLALYGVLQYQSC